MKHVVIIGNGVAGITAARHIRKLSDVSITVISSETPYFFSRTALMYVYMGHLTFEHTKPYEDWFWKKNRINLVYDHAEQLDHAGKSILLRSGKSIAYDILILATGSNPNPINVPGNGLRGVQPLYSYQDLQLMQATTRDVRNAVVVGGGLIGVEMAEMLHSRKIHVTLLVREGAFWSNVLPLPEATMISRHIISHGIDVRHNCELAEVLSDDKGHVRSVRTTAGEEIACGFVGIAVGVQPNVGWLKTSPLHINQGIFVNEFLETNLPGVYAIGDCAEKRTPPEGRKHIEQVWYTARMMGETVAQTICGYPTMYRPGPWFNSAKFFDIEFQNYGTVPNELRETESELYWEHQSGRIAVHLVWKKDTDRFLGINSFGIRLRHELFDKWLREKQSIRYVIEHLAEANFDPEFSKKYEADIAAEFSRQQLVSENR